MREPPERADRCVHTRLSTPQARTDVVVAHAFFIAIPIPIENTAKTSESCGGGGAPPAPRASSSPHPAEIPPLSRVRRALHEDPELCATLGFVREEADLPALYREMVPELRLALRHVHPFVAKADKGIRRRGALVDR